jgi:hypothetical protein
MLAEIFLVRLETLMRHRAQESKPPAHDPRFVAYKPAPTRK